MRITADTNLLVRIITKDDAVQARIAFDIVSKAGYVVIPLACLCEVAWVLQKIYQFGPEEVAEGIRAITIPANVKVEEPAVRAGLQMLALGGDFADGVIAAAGRAMGGDVFVSFDRRALSRLASLGLDTRHPDAVASEAN